MGLILRIEKRKLGAKAKAVFEKVETGSANVYVPGMVFAEILYLWEKKRIATSLEMVSDYFQKFTNYIEYPMNFEVIRASGQIDDIPELHDRLIAGTARYLNLALITNDPVIQDSSYLETLW